MAEINLDDLKINHEVTARKKGFSIFTLFFVFLLGFAGTFCAIYFYPPVLEKFFSLMGMEQEKQKPAETTQKPAIEEKEVVEEVETPQDFSEGGWVEVPSYHPVIVSALIPGRLEELKVLEGSKVSKGDVIAILYQRDIKDELRKAEADVKVTEAELERLRAGFRKQEIEKAKAELAAQEADRDLKEQIYKRTSSLVASGVVSQEDAEKDLAALNVAIAQCETLKQELNLKNEGYRKEEILAAEAELEKRKSIVKLAQNKLEYTQVLSPITGVVLERFVTPGAYILTAHPRIVSLYDPQDLQVRVDVRQENISKVFLNQAVEIYTDVEPDRAYKGKVIRIDPKADFKKNTIQAKIKILDPSGNLYPEMIARVKFIRSSND